MKSLGEQEGFSLELSSSQRIGVKPRPSDCPPHIKMEKGVGQRQKNPPLTKCLQNKGTCVMSFICKWHLRDPNVINT